MAGKPKYGLDFYYKPTNEFDDLKIRRITKQYKFLGYAIYNALLTLIYQNGQHYKFNNLDDLAFIISENIYSNEEETKEIIKYMIDIDLFDKELFNKGYLTNIDIQEHYFHATKRRKIKLLHDGLLLNSDYLENLILVNIDGIFVYIDEKDVNNDTVIVDKDKQSHSNSQSQSKNLDKVMIKDTSLDEASVPFKINYYLKILLDNQVISITDKFVEELNDFFNSIKNEYHYEDLTEAVRYTASFLKKSQWLDSNKREVVNKRQYIESAIIDGVNNVIRNKNRSFSVFDEDYEEFIEEYRIKELNY